MKKSIISALLMFGSILLWPSGTKAASTLDQYCKIKTESSTNVASQTAYQTFVPKQNRLTSVILEVSGDGKTEMNLMIAKSTDDGSGYYTSKNSFYPTATRQSLEFFFDNAKLIPGVEYKIQPFFSAFKNADVEWYWHGVCYAGGEPVINGEVWDHYDFLFQTYGYTYIPLNNQLINQPSIAETNVADVITQPTMSLPDPIDYAIPDLTKEVPDDVKNYNPEETEEPSEPVDGQPEGAEPSDTQDDFPTPQQPQAAEEEAKETTGGVNYPPTIQVDETAKVDTTILPPSLTKIMVDMDWLTQWQSPLTLTNQQRLTLYGQAQENASIHLRMADVTYLVKTDADGNWFAPVPLNSLVDGNYPISAETVIHTGFKSTETTLLNVNLHQNKTSDENLTVMALQTGLKPWLTNPIVYLIASLVLTDSLVLGWYIRQRRKKSWLSKQAASLGLDNLTQPPQTDESEQH